MRGCAREHLRLVIFPIKLHSRRVQPIDAVPLKMPFPGPQFLEGECVALAGFFESELPVA